MPRIEPNQFTLCTHLHIHEFRQGIDPNGKFISHFDYGLLVVVFGLSAGFFCGFRLFQPVQNAYESIDPVYI